MIIYLAGKISGEDRKATISKFESARRILTSLDFEVLVPTVLPVLDGLSQEDYLHICYAMIDVCHVVCFLPDWKQSAGASLEYAYARQKNKQIWYYSDLTSI